MQINSRHPSLLKKKEKKKKSRIFSLSWHFLTVLRGDGLQQQGSDYRHREGHDCSSSFARYHLRRREMENAGRRALRWPERGGGRWGGAGMMVVVTRGWSSHRTSTLSSRVTQGGNCRSVDQQDDLSTTAATCAALCRLSARVGRREGGGGNHLFLNRPV